MRCSEARRRIDAAGIDGSSFDDDRELREHLRGCRACARVAAAARQMSADLHAAAEPDLDGGLPFSVLRARIEAAEASRQRARTESSFMTTTIRNIRRRSRLSITVAAVVAAALVMSLVPFSFEQTVGYEVAVAGVNKDLALDNNRVTALLDALGVPEAKVDVTGCEETCKLVVRELKTSGDAKLVAAAFSGGNNSFTLSCDAIEVKQKEASTLLGHVGQVIQCKLTAIGEDGQVQDVLVERLGEACNGDGVTWMAQLSDSACAAICGDLPTTLEGCAGQSFTASASLDKLSASDDNEFVIESIVCDGPNSMKASVCIPKGADSLCCGLIGAGGVLDADRIEALRAKGCTVVLDTLTDGAIEVRVGCKNGSQCMVAEDAAGAEDAAAKAVLPEGYALEQNYPNPFNPTTTILFRLPEAQHVALEIYNVQGRRVRSLVDDVLGAGEHMVEWDARNDGGQRVASGVYLYRLTAGEHSASKKMTLLK